MECIDKWLLRNNRLCPVCKRRVIPGGSDSESEDGGHDSSANTSTGLLAADQTRSNQQEYVESAPNEDEDTNESSRLLVTSNVTMTVASNSSFSPHLQNVNTNRRAQADDSASLLVTVGNQQHPSLSEMNEITSDLISLNNHMTTSIGSGASTQIFLQSGGASNNGNLLNPNQSIASKYGSISSINQINSNSNAKISGNPYQYQNLNYQVKSNSKNSLKYVWFLIVYFQFKDDQETDERQEANTAKNQIQQAIPESDARVDDFVEGTYSINDDDGQYVANKQETQSRIKNPTQKVRDI